MERLIYFVKCRRYVKIGYTSDLSTRLTEMQVGNPFELEVIATMPDGTFAMERVFHEVLWRQRGRGEWFKLDKRLAWMIAAIKAGARPVTYQDVQYLLEIQRDIRKARHQQHNDERHRNRKYAEIDALNRGGGA